MTKQKTGLFAWCELNTNDLDKSKRFYTELLNWKTQEMKIGKTKYTTLHVGDQMVGGIMVNDPKARLPTFWMQHVTVKDVDKALEKTTKLGGKVLVPAMDVPEVGRFGVVSDPEGGMIAPFKGLKDAPEPPKTPPVGHFSWYEIFAKNTEQAKKFYTGIFDWKINTMPMGEMGEYSMFKVGAIDVAGIMPITEDIPAPPMWLAYVTVKDVDQAAKRAKQLGGKIHKEPFDVPNVGRIAIVEDNLGAVIGLFGTSN